MIAVLFDLDGVLLDTEGQYSLFWSRIGRRYFPSDVDFVTKIKGRVLKDICSIYFSEESQRNEVQAQLQEYEKTMAFPYIKGAEELVKSLRRNGVKSAVVTSSNRSKMNHVYEAIPDFENQFTKILMAEDFVRPKPAPDCYLQASADLGVKPSECVVFEDSFNGLKAARAAGMFVVGLTTTLPSSAVSEYADWVVPDFSVVSQEKLEALMAEREVKNE